MQDDRDDAAGVLVLREVTPIIAAIFGGYSLDLEHQTAQEVRLSNVREDQPTWGQIFEMLAEHARQLCLSFASDDYETVLRVLGQYFDVPDEVLTSFTDTVWDLDSPADVHGLFILARMFDDGHGLQTLQIVGPWRQEALSREQLGGHSRYISHYLTLHHTTRKTWMFGDQLSAAIASQQLAVAADLIFNEITDEILDGIYHEGERATILAHLAARFAATQQTQNTRSPALH